MAYASEPQPMRPQGAKRRPATVLAVAVTMYVTAISLITTAIGLFATQGDIRTAIEAGLLEDPSFTDADWAADEIAAIVTFSLRATAVVYLFLAVFYLVLPIDAKGRRSVRVLSWILAGVSLACCGIGGIVMRHLVTSMSYMGESYDDRISDTVLQATPTWLTVSQWTSLSLLIVGSPLVIVLLAMPASTAYFHAEEPTDGPGPEQP